MGIRKVIESIVFAGMKTGSERPDPLYVSNRTFVQKAAFAAVIGIPCLVVAALMVAAMTNVFQRKPVAAQIDPTPAETAAKMLPDVNQIKVDTNHDLEVIEVHVDRSGKPAVAGAVRNNTNHMIHDAEIVFDLSDINGSQLGGVKQELRNIMPHLRTDFRLPVAQANAVFVLVREVKVD